MFILRDYDKRDFETIFKLDRLCFEPDVAYSRPELASFIEQRRAYTVVAEWNHPAPETAPEAALPTVSDADQSAVHEPALHESAISQPIVHELAMSAPRAVSFSRNQPRPPRPALAGFVTFHYQRQGYGHIITIDVHPDARRHRLGTLLINAVCERLRKMTAFMVVLEVAVNNHSALAFYDKHGFKRVKVLERYYSRDVDAIFMTKRL
jgi:ribosomal protein S18 acetylase RimI-like enzyme